MTEALRFPLLEPPERMRDLDIFDDDSGDKHQGNMCGSVTCLYKGAGTVGFVKVNLNFDFFCSSEIMAVVRRVQKGEKTVDIDLLV